MKNNLLLKLKQVKKRDLWMILRNVWTSYGKRFAFPTSLTTLQPQMIGTISIKYIFLLKTLSQCQLKRGMLMVMDATNAKIKNIIMMVKV